MSRETCLLARIRGRVQGVCFRHYTQLEAGRLGIRGWVRNMPDGSVEACICGTPDQIEAMQQWLRRGPSYAEVTDIDFKSTTLPDGHQGFTVRC